MSKSWLEEIFLLEELEKYVCQKVGQKKCLLEKWKKYFKNTGRNMFIRRSGKIWLSEWLDRRNMFV